MTRTVACFIVAAALAGAVSAQFNYTDFSSTSGLVLTGNASQVGNVIEINPAAASQVGYCWYGTQQQVVGGFDTTFVFRITPTGQGADGMAFIIHDDPIGTALAGPNGGGIGYSGVLSNSVVIELDTYLNGGFGDISSNELSIHTNGTGINTNSESMSIGSVTPTITMADGILHTMRVEYLLPGTLNVYIDNLSVPLLSVPYSFQTGGTFQGGGAVGGLSLPTGGAWFGFSGSTGAITQANEIFGWLMQPPPPPCYPGNGGDADIRVFVNGQQSVFSTGKHPVNGGDILSLRFASPGGGLFGRGFLGTVQILPTGSVAPINIAGLGNLYFDLTPGAPTVVLFNGLPGGPGPILPVLGASRADFVSPSILHGLGLSLWAVCLADDPSAPGGVFAFALSDTEEIILQ